MAHHPTSAHSGSLNGIVHGAMILVIAINRSASPLSRPPRPRPAGRARRAGRLCARLFGHVGAATINGFVVPAVAAHGVVVSRDIFLFAWRANQALARLGVYANAAAFLLWSLDFLRPPGLEPRLIGLSASPPAAVPALLLAAGLIRMDVPGALTAYAAFAAWAAIVGCICGGAGSIGRARRQPD
jgi:hypothetical protein